MDARTKLLKKLKSRTIFRMTIVMTLSCMFVINVMINIHKHGRRSEWYLREINIYHVIYGLEMFIVSIAENISLKKIDENIELVKQDIVIVRIDVHQKMWRRRTK